MKFNAVVAVFKKTLKKHWLILLVSFIIGFVVVSPNIFFMSSSYYKGLPLMHTDSEDMYLGRINGTYNGCIMSCNPFVKQADNLPFFDPSILPAILAVPGMALGIPIIHLKVFYEFFIPFVLSLLICGLIFRITKSNILAVTGSIVILLGGAIINAADFIYFPNIIETLRLGYIEHLNYLYYARIVNPALSSVVFFSYLHILLSTLRNPSRKNFIWLSLLLGFSFYAYFYTYMFLTIIQGLATILFITNKDQLRARRFFLSGLVGVIIGSPILIQIIKLTQHPEYTNLYHYGIVKTHFPLITLFGLAILLSCVVLFLIYKKKFKNISYEVWFLITLVGACFLASNQHILTGSIVQYFHFDLYYNTPVLILTLCFITSLTLKKKWQITIAIPLIILVFMSAYIIQKQTYFRYFTRTVSQQKYIPALNFLNSQIPKNTVIISPPLQNLLPIYTNLYQVWSDNSELYYLHSIERRGEGRTALASKENLQRSISKYEAEYLALAPSTINDIHYDLIPFIESEVYKDEYITIYKLQKN